MYDEIEFALRPPVPGRFLRLLAPVSAGVRTTTEQIESHASMWSREAHEALASGLPVIVVMGDSLSQGIGSSNRRQTWIHGVADLVSRRTRQEHRIVNLSRSGARIDDVMTSQFPALEAISRSVTLVTCTVGNNDLVRSPSFGRTQKSMRKLILALPETAVVATLPAKGSILARRLNGTIRAESERRGRMVADVDRHLPDGRADRPEIGSIPTIAVIRRGRRPSARPSPRPISVGPRDRDRPDR